MERKREVVINDLKESINSLDQNFKTMFKNDIKNMPYGDLLELEKMVREINKSILDNT